MSSEGRNSIIFLRPRQIKQEKKERKLGPWAPPLITHEIDEEDEIWKSEGVYNQISTTYDSIIERKIKDERYGYFIIEFNTNVYTKTSKKILKKFDANILIHIEPLQSKVLVESPYENIKEVIESKHLKYIEKNIFLIRPLKVTEIISKEVAEDEWEKKNPDVIIEVMPNISNEKRNFYINKIIEYVSSFDIKIKESHSFNYLKDKGMLLATASLRQCHDLVEDTNIIYKIHRNPKIKISKIKSNKRLNSSRSNPANKIYPICVVDTGLEVLDQLCDVVENISYESNFRNGSDVDNHGTPISCLVAFGEGYDTSNPANKIISHKIFSKELGIGDLFTGLINAIQLYKEKTKIFVSSVHYDLDNETTQRLTARLNQFIQENEVSVIFCTGNYLGPFSREDYPNYILNNQIHHPGDAISITAVGGKVNYSDQNTIAPVNGPSPFTRIGCSSLLECCIKPEVVQHAGNCDENGISHGCGVKTFNFDGEEYDDVGTSFASPLFARNIARVYSVYQNNFSYPETARAIAYSSCRKDNSSMSKFLGFGESNFDNITTVGWNDTKMAFEGTIPLHHIENDTEYEIFHRLRFNAPAGIGRLDLWLVNSDNYQRYLRTPRLNTYLNVRTRKPSNERPVAPKFRLPTEDIPGKRNPGEKAHVKHLAWWYSGGTIGPWIFEFRPKSIVIPKDERQEVTVRYGGVIQLNARKPILDNSLTERFKSANGIP